MGGQADERLKELFTLSERLADIQAQSSTVPSSIIKEEPALVLDEAGLNEIYTKEIQRGTGMENGKFPMQALFSEFPKMSKKEAQEVIRKFYSTTYGHSSSESGVEHTKKGIDFYKLGTILPWREVSEKVRELVIKGEYLRNPQEVTEYQAWLDDADTQYSSWHDYQDLKEKIQATYQISPEIETISLFDEISELATVDSGGKTLEPLRILDDLRDSQQLGFEKDTSHQKLVEAENETVATGKYYIQLSEGDDSYYIDEIRMGDVLIATNSTNVLANAMVLTVMKQCLLIFLIKLNLSLRMP